MFQLKYRNGVDMDSHKLIDPPILWLVIIIIKLDTIETLLENNIQTIIRYSYNFTEFLNNIIEIDSIQQQAIFRINIIFILRLIKAYYRC